MCAGGEASRLLLHGPVATGILDSYASAVALSFYKFSPRRGREGKRERETGKGGIERIASPKIYEPTPNGLVRAMSWIHTCRGLVTIRRIGKPPHKDYEAFCFPSSRIARFLRAFKVPRHLTLHWTCIRNYICAEETKDRSFLSSF